MLKGSKGGPGKKFCRKTGKKKGEKKNEPSKKGGGYVTKGKRGGG